MSRWLYLLVLIPSIVSAEMINPIHVSRQSNQWTKLVYPDQMTPPGEPVTLQLCLRATTLILTAPRLNILPDEGRDDKKCFSVSEVGFWPHEEDGTPPYITYRIVNECEYPMVVTPKVWVREER